MIIGDTPAQLGQIKAADAMMIDGKIVTRDDYRALTATVDALRDALDKIANWNECTSEFRVNFGSKGERDFYRAVAAKALEATPQHHLRQVRADAGRDGFIAGYMLCNDGAALLKHNYNGMADKYAASILAGKE